ncbi:MFS transporter [Brevibacillus fluminis]|uniref:MFS transporter n=1 Tax=Brevibacillus fluminis TaxID=511487 RepID=A0A3M8DHT6_9BACL|nr:MFS transporter [Brevibacillus fluminis]RNB86935.1 MFS transporter [Brevibacillus fluminis]
MNSKSIHANSPDEGAQHAPKLVRLLCFILLFSVSNVTMFNIALSDIAKDFGLLPSEVSWVVTGYSIMYAIGSLTYGKLADRFPLRRLLTAGLFLFAAGSILGFASQNYGMLIAARLVQSAGAAAIPALAMLLPVRLFAVERRGQVIGIIASAIAFGAGVGPILGGFIASSLNWRYLFLISVITLVTVPFFRKWLPREETQPGSFDFPGAVLLAGTVASFMLCITRWNGWFLLVSLFLLVLFTVRMRKAEQPFIQLSLLANTQYRSALISCFLVSGASFAILLVTPMMLHNVLGMETGMMGLVMFPGAMSAALLGRYGGKWADRKGSLFVLFIGLLLMMLGQFALSTASGHVAWIVAACLVFVNVGMSFFQVSTTKVVSTTLPAGQTGVGMGIFSLTNFMAGAVSGAVISKIIDHTGTVSPVNPFAVPGAAALYSNVYLGLIAVTVLGAGIVYAVFGRKRANFEGLSGKEVKAN